MLHYFLGCNTSKFRGKHKYIVFVTLYLLAPHCVFMGLQMLKWDKIGVSNVAGELALLSGLAMWATTFPRIRRKIFELFFYTHHLYIFFIVLFVLHVGISYSCIMLPGFYLFLIDRYLRFIQSRQRVRLVAARLLPCGAVEMNFSKAPGKSTVAIDMVLCSLLCFS